MQSRLNSNICSVLSFLQNIVARWDYDEISTWSFDSEHFHLTIGGVLRHSSGFRLLCETTEVCVMPTHVCMCLYACVHNILHCDLHGLSWPITANWQPHQTVRISLYGLFEAIWKSQYRPASLPAETCEGV